MSRLIYHLRKQCGVPTLIWPYTVLEVVGILVFVYIFFSLNDYGYFIDSATNATENVEKLQC
ncbi:hypothetical protein L6475_00805 [Prevotella sp. E9-3]|uniref:hypothetical protein n=1 Tax=Prevotella sp. E9-3 TaxID=2913621 RepID=UPI001EDC85FB|nr:hypothetical protein [Prevotella sp. E9-3]UKK48537.1 hypothetical protein L6475_00805 [Prevotella sp. E9-3]